MARQFVKYNPAFLDSDRLIDNFVVRKVDLSMILRVVRENHAASNQHLLVIGPRGSGKTTLVRRVAAEVERDEELQKGWYSLVFAEESYNALSTADFWLESLFHLAEQSGERRWMDIYHELRRDPDEQRLAERALGQLLDFADGIGKRILLIVENFDMLLSEFSGNDEAWKLRHTLMNEPRLMLLATATGRFNQIDDIARPMFEMFRIHDLKPLDDDACNAIWALVAGDPLPGQQIRPIRILTGGNARLITLIARFGANRSFHDLLEDLVDLIDEHTDYFKSHLDNMAPTERKVYLALAELWSLSTAKEVSEVARIDVNRTSALLNRLVSRGRVVIEGDGKRKKRYRVSEGIYNIYYLMRRRGSPSARVKAAVRFMVSLYNPVSAAKILVDEAGVLASEQCRDHMFALAEVYLCAPDTQRLEIASLVPSAVFDSPYLEAKIRDEMKARLVLGREDNEELEKILKRFGEAINLSTQEQYEAAIALFQDTIDQYAERDEAEIEVSVARGILVMGIELGKMERTEDAIAAYDALVKRYGERDKVEIAVSVARGMLVKGIELDKMERTEEAIAVCDALVKRYGERDEAEIVVSVAQGLLIKGEGLLKMKRTEESFATYDELVGRYGERDEAEINYVAFSALIIKVWVLLRLHKIVDALACITLLFNRMVFPCAWIEQGIELIVEIASCGYAAEALRILVGSPAEQHFEPLVAGLRLYCGQEVNTATEILEVANDVVKRIEARKRALEACRG